ncbi:hypothetical protein [Deinococcus sp.]|uniref:hypothetical protein n=1 Tax=Deinococcus sp. TaxID=47478 RepID=UPI003CC5DA04
MRAALTLLTALLVGSALVLAGLCLGALASLNGASPPLLGALSAAETVLSGRLHLGLETFWRSLTWAGLCCVCVWFAAYLKPR